MCCVCCHVFIHKNTQLLIEKTWKMLLFFFFNVYVVYICILICCLYVCLCVIEDALRAESRVSNVKLETTFFFFMCFMFSATSLAQNMSRNSMKRWRKKMK